MNRTRYLTNSFYYTESIHPIQTSTTRRQDGGLLMLTNPSLKQNISLLYNSKYSIKIKLLSSNQTLAFVYFPPSLSNESISNELNKLGHTDAIIGDINIRLGKLSGDKISNALSRKHTLYNFFSLYHLRYIRNSNSTNVSRTDHIFSNLNNLIWTYEKPSFQSDHQLMSISLKQSNPLYFNPLPTTYRYDFKPLMNSLFQNEFIFIFERDYAINLLIECETALATCCHSMILPSTNDTQELIDLTYNHFIDTIQHLLDSSLTTYDANAVKSQPDTLSTSNNNFQSNSNIIRSFKRSQRAINSKTPIKSSNLNQTPLQECQSHYNDQFNSTDPPPSIERQNDTIFGLLFNQTEIKKRILQYPISKSMGPDNIHTLVWKTLTKSTFFMQTISSLFQLFSSTSLVPSSWATCNLHLLIKEPTNPIAANTRPIALCNILRRIFEKMLLKLWIDKNDNWTRLNYGQAGFRRGYSTMSHLVLSDEISRRQSSFSIFLDIKSAFDSVSWSKLKELLISRNCPPTDLNLILSLICKPATLSLSVNHSEKVSIFTRKGVFQGGGISAFIFSLYIDPLAASINCDSPLHHPLGLFFADDIQIKPRYISEAQLALDKCSTYGKEYNLVWNLKKCSIVSRNPLLLHLNNEVLPNTGEYKYLGIIHQWDGLNLLKSFTSSVTKTQSLLTALSDNSWHPKSRMTIYRCFIRPISEYSSILTYIWAQKATDRNYVLNIMKSQHHLALNWIFHRKQYLETLDYLSGLGPWYYRLECLRGSLTRSFRHLHYENPLLAARSIFLLSSSKNFILQDCFTSKYWSTYQTETTEKQKTRSSWNTWKHSKLKSLAINASKHSATIAYSLPLDSRTTRTFFNLPTEKFYIALSWRLNRSFLNHTCTCHSRFTRSHIDCVLQTNELYESHLTSSKFHSSLKNVSSATAANYCVLDYLLNEQKYDEFFALFSSLKEKLIQS